MRPSSLFGLLRVFLTRTRQGRIIAASIGASLLFGSAVLAAAPWDRNEDCGHMPQPYVEPQPVERFYAFYDSDTDQLRALQADLEALGYHSARIGSGPAWPSDLQTLFILKTDQLDLPSLRAREDSLCDLAKQHRVESFWSMGPTDPALRPKRNQPH